MLVLGGPNLGRLGRREPDVYGSRSYQDLVSYCESSAAARGLVADVRQTDTEATMLHWLHEASDGGQAVVVNPAAWTHTSVALRDAAAELTTPLIEVHLSNIFAREAFRQQSYLSGVATGVISGLGFGGYRAALGWLAELRDQAQSSAAGTETSLNG